MRLAPLLLACSLACSVAAQHDQAALVELVKALQGASRDAQRDSLSERVKGELRRTLEADDAPTASFADVPMSRVDAVDGRFRLFTWNVPHDDGTHRYEGFLLVVDKKRRVLYELRDMTERIATPARVELGPDEWYGALYYDAVPVRKGAKTYYTLLGWKGHSRVENRKVIDVLSFKGVVPKFGAPVFGTGKAREVRKVYAYSAQNTMSLRWEPQRQWIVLDHLAPERADLEGQAAFTGPGLSFDAFVWEKDHWALQRDVDVRGGSPRKPYNTPPKEH